MSELEFLKNAGEAIFVDREVKKARELLKQWRSDEAVAGLALIGAPLSKTSISHSGAHLAPEIIRKMLASYTTYAIEDDIDLHDQTITDFGDITMHVTDLLTSHDRIEKTLGHLFLEHPRMTPIILGGDHGISCPSIKAFAKAKKTVGVIQFDAHHDLRNLEDGGPSNGTPFRGLIDSATIKGEHLCQIGIRNFSNSKPYTQYAKEKGITVYTMRDVREKGIRIILKECIKKLENQVDAIYVSVDMDVLDQAFAPGCPAIGPGGMNTDDLFEGIRKLAKEQLVKGLDIVEIDPTLDFRDMTSRVAAQLILQFCLARINH
jgi:formiminoglutamase